jgi:hypothetical protein
MSNEIQNIVDEIKSNLVLITNNNGVQLYGIKEADIELIERLADERGQHNKYQYHVAYRFNSLLKTSQTTQDGSKRVDTLSLDEKRVEAEKWVDTIFTAKESAATKQKKAITNGADLVSQIDEAKANGDKKRASELQEQLNDMMRAFVTK